MNAFNSDRSFDDPTSECYPAKGDGLATFCTFLNDAVFSHLFAIGGVYEVILDDLNRLKDLFASDWRRVCSGEPSGCGVLLGRNPRALTNLPQASHPSSAASCLSPLNTAVKGTPEVCRAKKRFGGVPIPSSRRSEVCQSKRDYPK